MIYTHTLMEEIYSPKSEGHRGPDVKTPKRFHPSDSVN